jgi:hypothetical protein
MNFTSHAYEQEVLNPLSLKPSIHYRASWAIREDCWGYGTVPRDNYFNCFPSSSVLRAVLDSIFEILTEG